MIAADWHTMNVFGATPLESRGDFARVPDVTAYSAARDVFLRDRLPRPRDLCLHRLLQIRSRSRGDAVDFSHARPDGDTSGRSFHRSQDGIAPIRPSEERRVRTRDGVDACVARYDPRFHSSGHADDLW